MAYATHRNNLAKLKAKPPRNQAQAAKTSPDAPLTAQQRLFVQAWAEGDSIMGALKRAGFNESDSYGYQLKAMPKIQKAYELEKAKYQEAAQLSRVDVMNGLKDAIDMARLMSEPATMIAGWREIGKLCGYYEPKKVDLNVNVNGTVMLERMNKMTDAELLEIINKAAEQGVEQTELLEDGTQGESDE